MNQKQLAYLQSILTPEQLTTFLEMKKTRPKKVVEITTEKFALPTCQATKKDKTKCSHKSKVNQHYCGVHLRSVEKADAVLLSATA